VTAFGFAIFLTGAMTGVLYLWARRRPAGASLSWGEAFVGGLFVFAWFVVLYGVLPDAWLKWCDGPLRWRSDKVGIPAGPLVYIHLWGFKWHPLTDGHKYLGFLKYNKGCLFPTGITFFGRGKIMFNAQDLRDIGVVVVYTFSVALQFMGVAWYQRRNKAPAAASRELPTSAYGRPLARNV
jgi:hypothetical protein